MSRPTYCNQILCAMCCFSGSDPSFQTVQKTNLENSAPADAHSQPQIRTSKEIRKS